MRDKINTLTTHAPKEQRLRRLCGSRKGVAQFQMGLGEFMYNPRQGARMTSGNLVVNGITELQLIKILEFKSLREGQFLFAVNALQPISSNPVMYNNAAFAWKDDNGLTAVLELMSTLNQQK
jgi:hypothetical protein